MRGMGSILAVLLALCLLPGAATAADRNPHIVLQSTAEAEQAVETAGWTPDGKYVLTTNGISRTVLIWEAATGRIIDRARLPAEASTAYGGLLRTESVTVSPDGRTALVRGIGIDATQGDASVPADFQVDLATRVVTALPRGKALPGVTASAGFVSRITALTALYEQGTEMTPEAAEKILPVLPRSPDGEHGLKRTVDGLEITGAGGRTLSSEDQTLGFDDAAMSPDGTMLAMVELSKNDEGDGKVSTTMLRFDMVAGRFLDNVLLPGVYGTVRWLDNARLLAAPGTISSDRDNLDADASAPLSPARVIEAASGKTLSQLPGRCYIARVATGFIAADAGACRHNVKGGTTVLFSDGTTWRPLKLTGDYAGKTIDGIATSPDGKLAALILVKDEKHNLMVVIDSATGAPIDELYFNEDQKIGMITSAMFTPDGSQLVVAVNGGAVVWPYGKGQPRQITMLTSAPQLMASDGKSVLMSAAIDSQIARADLATGATMMPIDLPNAVAGGFLPGKPIFWAASGAAGVRLYDTHNWRTMVTLYPIDGGNFVAVTPDGRYDTNLGPDAAQFRWIVPDAPFQSLGPQAFMRDYFTPRLADKAINCTVAGNCDQALAQLPSLTALNRVLPVVKITAIEPNSPGYVTVSVEAHEGIDTAAANGKTRSGVYNVRLFRNGQLTDQMPTRLAEGVHDDLSGWRQGNAVEPGPDGSWSYPFVVPLPSGPDVGKQVFTAYAYNEDRVKSETARMTFKPPPTAARPRRAYIVTVGIDDYDEARLKLRFSTADAKLIGERLAVMPGYEVRRLDLTTTPGADGKPRRVTTDTIRAAFRALAAGPAELDDMASDLRGFDLSQVDKVTPDDLVIISWSGHGWADPQGDFFLLTSDARWPAGGKPEFGKMVSASDMTGWLRDLHAGEMAFIIDACHSGASVDSANFKPGPMGDPGLGQLAYDKGMRILAATQASDIAIEDARVGQGLLTYALAGEGVTASGGRADLNKDGRITLDEWLRYAVQRLPSLSADVKLGKVASARGFDLGSQQVVVKAQEPALFDFTNKPSPVVLRTGVK